MRRARVASITLAGLALAGPLPAQHATAPPTAAAWRSAETVTLPRRTPRCVVLRAGEWMKVRCSLPAGAIEQLAGSARGVSLSIDGNITTSNPFEAAGIRTAEIVFPVAPGDARYFEIQAFRLRLACGLDECWPDGNSWATAARVSEQWLAGEAAPTVSVVDIDLGDDVWRVPMGETPAPPPRRGPER